MDRGAWWATVHGVATISAFYRNRPLKMTAGLPTIFQALS